MAWSSQEFQEVREILAFQSHQKEKKSQFFMKRKKKEEQRWIVFINAIFPPLCIERTIHVPDELNGIKNIQSMYRNEPL